MDPGPGSKKRMNLKILFPFLLQIIGITSVFLATSTFLVTTWIVLTQYWDNSDTGTASLVKCSLLFNTSQTTSHSHTHSHTSHPPVHDMGPINVEQVLNLRSCKIFLTKFQSLLTTNVFASGVASLLQFGGTVYLITGALEDFVLRSRSWVGINIGANLVYIICLTATRTFPLPPNLGGGAGGGAGELFGLVQYLPGYWIILEFNIVLGSFLLLLVLLLIRYLHRVGVGSAGFNYSSLLVTHHL